MLLSFFRCVSFLVTANALLVKLARGLGLEQNPFDPNAAGAAPGLPFHDVTDARSEDRPGSTRR